MATSNGYAGTSDGWTDLADHKLDTAYTSAPDGNVVQTAKLALDGKRDTRLTLALGFGSSGAAAVKTARASLVLPFWLTSALYAWGWDRYLDDLRKPPKSVKHGDLLTQYRVAAMTLKAHEDKTFRGANIASLTVPWGQAVNADEAGVGGYHLVWARDLYQVSTAQIAIGDSDAANRSLDYLFEVQQKPDGSFPQNTLLDGTPYFGSLQLDEVAFPIVMAWQLRRTDRATYTEHVKPAARLPRRARAFDAAGALGGGGRLLAEHDRGRDRGPDRGRLAGPLGRRSQLRGALPGRRRRVAAARRVVDVHDDRSVRLRLLRAHRRQRQPERRPAAGDQQRRRHVRRALDRRLRLPRARAARRQARQRLVRDALAGARWTRRRGC